MRHINDVDVLDKAYDELVHLVAVQKSDEDAAFAAFSSLCPTGKEGAFDADKVALYANLLEAGLIEGVAEEDAFFFQGITEAGIACVEGRELVGTSYKERVGDVQENAPAAPAATPSPARTAPAPQTASSGMGRAIAAGAIAGFIAGIVGAWVYVDIIAGALA